MSSYTAFASQPKRRGGGRKTWQKEHEMDLQIQKLKKDFLFWGEEEDEEEGGKKWKEGLSV